MQLEIMTELEIGTQNSNLIPYLVWRDVFENQLSSALQSYSFFEGLQCK